MIIDELNKKISDIENLANDKTGSLESKVNDLTDGILMVADAVDTIPELVDEKIAVVTKEITAVKDEIKKVKTIKGEQGERGEAGIDGVDGKNGDNGKDGSPDTAEQIADKLNTLEGVIDIKVIKDLEFPDVTDMKRQIETIGNQTLRLLSRKQSDNTTSSGNPAGSSSQIQYNNSGNFGADAGFFKTDETFGLGLLQTQQSAVTFTGSGLDDLAIAGTFSGTVPTTYTVTIDGVNQDFLFINTSTITGGTFNVGDTITSGTGGLATVLSISNIVYPSFGIDAVCLRVTVTSPFSNNETVDNGLGVSGTLGGNTNTVDTVEWTDGVVTETNYPVSSPVLFLNNGVLGQIATTGHTLSDEWTWTYSNVQNNILDFSNGTYKFGTDFGNDYFGYEVGNNILGFGLKGSLNTYTSTGGDLAFSGIMNNSQAQIIDHLSFSDGSEVTQSLIKNQYDISVNNGTEFSSIGMTSTTFETKSALSSGEHGISQSAGVVTVGNLTGGNNTKITIDDVNEHITISNLPAYDDDAAAGTGGLTAGMVYMTTGSGSAPLNAAGILMIKQ